MMEHKLILLYLINKMDLPLSQGQISQFVLEENYMDFFLLQETLLDISESGHLERNHENNAVRYVLTELGKTTLDYFAKRIPKNIMDKIDEYVLNNKKSLKKDYEVIASYFYDQNSKEYNVKLGAYDDNTTIMEIALSVVTKDQARYICDNWKNNINSLYLNILNELISSVETDDSDNK